MPPKNIGPSSISSPLRGNQREKWSSYPRATPTVSLRPHQFPTQKFAPMCPRPLNTEWENRHFFWKKGDIFFFKIFLWLQIHVKKIAVGKLNVWGNFSPKNSCLASFGLVRCRSSPAAPPPKKKKNDPSSASERKGKRIPGHEIREKGGRGKC